MNLDKNERKEDIVRLMVKRIEETYLKTWSFDF